MAHAARVMAVLAMSARSRVSTSPLPPPLTLEVPRGRGLIRPGPTVFLGLSRAGTQYVPSIWGLKTQVRPGSGLPGAREAQS